MVERIRIEINFRVVSDELGYTCIDTNRTRRLVLLLLYLSSPLHLQKSPVIFTNFKFRCAMASSEPSGAGMDLSSLLTVSPLAGNCEPSQNPTTVSSSSSGGRGNTALDHHHANHAESSSSSSSSSSSTLSSSSANGGKDEAGSGLKIAGPGGSDHGSIADVFPALAAGGRLLEPGSMFAARGFSLRDAISAVEIGDPRVDSGASAGDRPERGCVWAVIIVIMIQIVFFRSVAVDFSAY
jgi:hypothetical protein